MTAVIPWILFVVFCSALDGDCTIHTARFDTEAQCGAARRELARALEPDGSLSVRSMVCARVVL